MHSPVGLGLGGQGQCDDQAVQTEYLGENQNQNHTDEQSRLLSRTSNAGVTDDADRKAGRQTGEAHRQAGAQMQEAVEGRVLVRWL